MGPTNAGLQEASGRGNVWAHTENGYQPGMGLRGDGAGSDGRRSSVWDEPVPLENHDLCRCWSTTTRELQSCLGVAVEHLDFGQLQRFVRTWHEVDQRYGPNRRAEANAALAAAVGELLKENLTESVGAGTAVMTAEVR